MGIAIKLKNDKVILFNTFYEMLKLPNYNKIISICFNDVQLREISNLPQ